MKVKMLHDVRVARGVRRGRNREVVVARMRHERKPELGQDRREPWQANPGQLVFAGGCCREEGRLGTSTRGSSSSDGTGGEGGARREEDSGRWGTGPAPRTKGEGRVVERDSAAPG